MLASLCLPTLLRASGNTHTTQAHHAIFWVFLPLILFLFLFLPHTYSNTRFSRQEGKPLSFSNALFLIYKPPFPSVHIVTTVVVVVVVYDASEDRNMKQVLLLSLSLSLFSARIHSHNISASRLLTNPRNSERRQAGRRQAGSSQRRNYERSERQTLSRPAPTGNNSSKGNIRKGHTTMRPLLTAF